MEIYLGKDKFNKTDIYWNPEHIINSHCYFLGTSGSGKTHRLRRILKSLQQYPLRILVFDTQGDIDTNPIYTSEVVFSNTSSKGLNPLKINLDRDYGGVKRRIGTFLNMIERYSANLGIKQKAVLRALLSDLYAANHIYTDKPATWYKQPGPSLVDLRKFAYSKLKSMIFGAENPGKDLKALNKHMKSLDKKLTEEELDADPKIKELREACVESYAKYVYSIRNGREVQEYINYDSKEVLKSVYNRIEILSEMSIFKDDPPDFDEDKTIHRYSISSIEREEQGYLVEIALEEIFLQQKAKGIAEGLEVVIMLDEAQKFVSDEDTHIINILIREGRKYGIGLIFSTQDMANLNRDILQNCGTKVILAIDEMFRENVSKKLGIDQKKLNFIQYRKTGIVQMKTLGDNCNGGKFTDIIFDE